MKQCSRRCFLSKTGLLSLAAFMSVPFAAQAKLSKKKAGYTTSPRGKQKCANCSLYKKNNRTCVVVNGTFSPNAWCKLWVGR